MPSPDAIDRQAPGPDKEDGVSKEKGQEASKPSPEKRFQGLKANVRAGAERVRTQFSQLRSKTPDAVLTPEADELEGLNRELTGIEKAAGFALGTEAVLVVDEPTELETGIDDQNDKDVTDQEIREDSVTANNDTSVAVEGEDSETGDARQEPTTEGPTPEQTDPASTGETKVDGEPAKTEESVQDQEKQDRVSEREVLEDDLIARFKEATGKEIDPAATYKYGILMELTKDADPSLLLEIFEPKYDALWTEKSVAHAIAINTIRQSLGKTTLDKEYVPTDAEKSMVVKLFDKFGFDLKDATNIFQAWTSYNNSELPPEENAEKRQNVVARNFWSMIDLKDRPECGQDGLKTLYDKYGIRNFARYDSSQLIDQLEGRVQTPPKVVVSATADWNGALSNAGYGGEDILGKGVTYVEAESTTDIARRLVKVSRDQGPIKEVLINAHGNSELMQFGRKNNQVLTTDQVEGSKGIPRLKDRGILDQKAGITLWSCDTGEKGGFAKVLAEATTAKVTAPDFKPKGIEKSGILKRVKFKDEQGKARAKTYQVRRRMTHKTREDKAVKAA